MRLHHKHIMYMAGTPVTPTPSAKHPSQLRRQNAIDKLQWISLTYTPSPLLTDLHANVLIAVEKCKGTKRWFNPSGLPQFSQGELATVPASSR